MKINYFIKLCSSHQILNPHVLALSSTQRENKEGDVDGGEGMEM
jgi:hypothetical protein